MDAAKGSLALAAAAQIDAGRAAEIQADSINTFNLAGHRRRACRRCPGERGQQVQCRDEDIAQGPRAGAVASVQI